MHILLITHFFPPTHNAGTENYTLGLAKAFIHKGHQVHVLCAEDWNSGPNYLNEVTEDVFDGVPVIRIHLNWEKASDPNRILFDSAPIENWLCGFLANNKIDLVHVTSLISLGAGVLRAVKVSRIPLVMTLMDFWAICPRTVLMKSGNQLCSGETTAWECQQCLLASSRMYRRIERTFPFLVRPGVWRRLSRIPFITRQRGARGWLIDTDARKAVLKEALGLPDVILSHSKFVKTVHEQAGISNRIRHLQNGQDLSWLANYSGKPATDFIRFGFMGQIARLKGVHLLIQAFILANRHGKARLEIWGNLDQDPVYADELKRQIGDLKNIHLRGVYRRDQIHHVLSEIDVLIVPSLWYENAPLVIQEAFATHTPVIATNLGGMAEAVHTDEGGLLFERGNSSDLARQLCRMIEERDLLGNLQRGVPAVKTVDQEIRELEDLYRGLIDSPTVQPSSKV